MPLSTPLTIAQAIAAYLDIVSQSRSQNTALTYHHAMTAFADLLAEKKNPVDQTQLEALPEEAFAWFLAGLKGYAPATERLYLTAAAGFYEYLSAEGLATPNLPKLRLLTRQRARRAGQRLPQFPREAIEKVLEHAESLASAAVESEADRLRNLRDRAFLITLADTGLRVHEACSMRRGDIDAFEGQAIIIGKGDKQAIVRFSNRSMKALKDYHEARAPLDGSSGKALGSLPLFARHDRGAGKKVKPITTTTGRDIVEQRVRESLGEAGVGTITPHSFRHYFVTTVLRGSGGNLKLAQELARHKNIQVTTRYAHLSSDELDQGYGEIFDE